MSSFPAYVAAYHDKTNVQEYAVDPGASIVVGSLVYFDTSDQLIKLCGADPALIAGLAEGAKNLAGYGPAPITPDGKVPIRLLSPGALVALSSPTTLSESDVGVAYGIVNTGGRWQIDTTDTSNTRVVVIRVDVAEQIGFVQFIAANLQFDAIAS